MPRDSGSTIRHNLIHRKGSTVSVYELFVHRKPACFGPFVLAEANDIDTDWGPGVEFVKKYVRCGCGETHLNIYACPGEDMYLAPVILECPKCHTQAEIFHPEKHGWDGMQGYNASIYGHHAPELLKQSPTRVLAEYSYQGEENYEDMLKDGVLNLEDYFDIFAISTVDDNGNLEDVTSYECA